MSGAQAAKRFPRERFNRTLAKLFGRLDERASVEIHVASGLWEIPSIQGRVRARVKRIWAVGSFSRGAPECLDCDLIVEAEASWLEPPVVNGSHAPGWGAAPEWHLYKRQLLGPPFPHVSVLSLEQAHHAKISDAPGGSLRPTFDLAKAVLLYGESTDWRKALASIKVDPAAGHFPRRYDALPLRIEQTGLSLKDADELLQSQAAGLLIWSFEPLAERVAPHSSLLSAVERAHLAQFASQGAGKKSMAVAGAALIATRSLRRARPWVLEHAGANGPGGKGIVFRFGKQRVGIDDFATTKCEAIVLVPHWTRQGPNRVWIIKRGPHFASRLRSWSNKVE